MIEILPGNGVDVVDELPYRAGYLPRDRDRDAAGGETCEEPEENVGEADPPREPGIERGAVV